MHVEADVTGERTGSHQRRGPSEPKPRPTTQRKDGALGAAFLWMHHDYRLGVIEHRLCHAAKVARGLLPSPHSVGGVIDGLLDRRLNSDSDGLAPVVMIQGCTSDAGKSLLVAALCRWFADSGVRVAPFKAQNMSNNAGVCADGGEIGRAQYVQALAARAEPDVRMNPILLKPTTDTGSSVIMMGRPAPHLTEVAWGDRRTYTWPVVQEALQSLRTDFDLVIAEGAGSPAEVNLRSTDIVNMAIALEADALVYLVADIDRGGAFAHLLGTVECLAPAERQLVKGFVLNKFRGDVALLHPAPEWLAEQTGIETVAVVPWIHHRLPDEDRLLLHADPASNPSQPSVRVALIAYPWASNFDEFEGLANLEGLTVDVIRERTSLDGYAAVILPGSRNTVASLSWLRSVGLAQEVTSAARKGAAVLGICGGMQMLGNEINDPEGLESGGLHHGMGLLDVSTVLRPNKTTRQGAATLTRTREVVHGYEIHHGVTVAGSNAVAELDDGLGWRSDNVTGIYLHGLLDDAAYARIFLGRLGASNHQATDRHAVIDAELSAVAEAVAQSGLTTRIGADLALGRVGPGGR